MKILALCMMLFSNTAYSLEQEAILLKLKSELTSSLLESKRPVTEKQHKIVNGFANCYAPHAIKLFLEYKCPYTSGDRVSEAILYCTRNNKDLKRLNLTLFDACIKESFRGSK